MRIGFGEMAAQLAKVSRAVGVIDIYEPRDMGTLNGRERGGWERCDQKAQRILLDEASQAGDVVLGMDRSQIHIDKRSSADLGDESL